MRKFKALIGKHYELLSVEETDDVMPEDENIYYDLARDMRVPDFVLIRTSDRDAAKATAEEFIERWKARLGD